MENNLYKAHLKESYCREYFENEYGYITWQPFGESVVINTLYIKPEYRNTGKGSTLADMVTEWSAGIYTSLLCEIDVRSNTYEEAYTAITKYGFKQLNELSDGNYIILSKEL